MRQEVFEYARRVKHAIPIPKGTPPAKCRGPRCNETVYFVANRIVSLASYNGSPEGIAPTSAEDGIGIDHHADCVDREMFTSKRKR